MKLIKVVTLQGTMEAKSGVCVRAGTDGVHMGGIDSEVIKNKLSGEPYIPGSSLKGKMRSMIEKVMGKGSPSGDPCGCGSKDCVVCTLFGAHKNPNADCGQRRMYVHETKLSREFIKEHPDMEEWTEVKASTAINRNSGTAAAYSLRKIERIPAGATFEYKISLEIFEGDNEKLLKSTVERALELVESTGIGGATSTGSGQVDFHSSASRWQEKVF